MLARRLLLAALLPDRPADAPSHLLGCRGRRIADRIISEKPLQWIAAGKAAEVPP